MIHRIPECEREREAESAFVGARVPERWVESAFAIASRYCGFVNRFCELRRTRKHARFHVLPRLVPKVGIPQRFVSLPVQHWDSELRCFLLDVDTNRLGGRGMCVSGGASLASSRPAYIEAPPPERARNRFAWQSPCHQSRSNRSRLSLGPATEGWSR